MAERQEHQPGTEAPATGHYEELNVFGTPTGRLTHVQEGERPPARHAASLGGGSRRKAANPHPTAAPCAAPAADLTANRDDPRSWLTTTYQTGLGSSNRSPAIPPACAVLDHLPICSNYTPGQGKLSRWLRTLTGSFCEAQRKSRPYRDRRWLAFAGPPAAYAAQLFI
jgi:hypothetical protein